MLTDLRRRPPWFATAVGGVVVFLVGAVLEVLYGGGGAALLVTLVVAAAVGTSRARPAVAVGLCWAAALLEVVGDGRLAIASVAVVAVAFTVARYGNAAVLWVSGLSVPAGGLLAALLVYRQGVRLPLGLTDRFSADLPYGALAGLAGVGLLALAGVGALGLPWLAGFAVRSREEAEVSDAARQEAEVSLAAADVARRQAEEIAELRAAQTALTRDVHDVVGHSLAVILVQAESAAYLPAGDSAAVRETLGAIAQSARTSLRDVRRVLSATPDAPEAPPGDLDDLLAGVRAAGAAVEVTERGVPRELPPAIATLVYRVQQELLTNALKHGRRDAPVRVLRTWGEALRVEITNTVADHALAPPAEPGLGLDGVRTRLVAVGGHLDVIRDDTEWLASAWIPVPADRP